MSRSMQALWRAIAAAAALGLAAVAVPAAATELIVNGSFETGDLTGWTVSGFEGTYQIFGADVVAPEDGTQFAYISSLFPHSYGTLTQTFSDVPGKLYEASFWYRSPDPQADTGLTDPAFARNLVQIALGVDVQENGYPLNYVDPPQSDAWVQGSFTFTGTGSDTLSLLATDSLGALMADNISVTDVVPEPDAWALMILGFGGAGAQLRRRRRPVAVTA